MKSDSFIDDWQMEREREIRKLGAASGWPCKAADRELLDLPDLSRGQEYEADYTVLR